MARPRKWHQADITAAIGKQGHIPEVACWVCGSTDHPKWVGDHVVPLALYKGSPIVPAGSRCNIRRRGVRATSLQMERLFRPAIEVGTHSGDEIAEFCRGWAAARYGSPEFCDLAIGDSGVAVPIKRASQHSLRPQPDASGQRIADKAYTNLDGHTAEEMKAFRYEAGRKQMNSLKRMAARRK